MQHKLQVDVEALKQKRQAAQGKLKALQQVLHDVQSQQKRWTAAVQDQAKLSAQFRGKNLQYQKQITEYQKCLDKHMFGPQVSVMTT